MSWLPVPEYYTAVHFSDKVRRATYVPYHWAAPSDPATSSTTTVTTAASVTATVTTTAVTQTRAIDNDRSTVYAGIYTCHFMGDLLSQWLRASAFDSLQSLNTVKFSCNWFM